MEAVFVLLVAYFLDYFSPFFSCLPPQFSLFVLVLFFLALIGSVPNEKEKTRAFGTLLGGVSSQGGKTTLNGFLHVAEKTATDGVSGVMK